MQEAEHSKGLVNAAGDNRQEHLDQSYADESQGQKSRKRNYDEVIAPSKEGCSPKDRTKQVMKEGKRTELRQSGRSVPKLSYDLKSRGLFVIINCYNSKESLTEGRNKSLSDSLKQIKEMFNLKLGTDSDTNVIYCDEVQPDSSGNEAHGTSFESLMKRALNYQGSPSFVFVIVMSYRSENGTFMLSGHGDCKEHKCSDNKHKKEGECYVRDTYYDVVRRFQGKYSGIPKVFVVPTFKSENAASGKDEGSKQPVPEEEPSAEDYIPQLSDILVLYSSSDKNSEGGSLLIKALWKAAQSLKTRFDHRADDFLKLMDNPENNRVMLVKTLPKKYCKQINVIDNEETRYNVDLEAESRYELMSKEMHIESLIGGWMNDVLQSVRNFLIMERSDTYLIIQSTLRKRLSFLQLINSQTKTCQVERMDVSY